VLAAQRPGQVAALCRKEQAQAPAGQHWARARVGLRRAR
jgi:hypothetical protein